MSSHILTSSLTAVKEPRTPVVILRSSDVKGWVQYLPIVRALVSVNSEASRVRGSVARERGPDNEQLDRKTVFTP